MIPSNRWRASDISPRLTPGATRSRTPRHGAPGRERRLTSTIASLVAEGFQGAIHPHFSRSGHSGSGPSGPERLSVRYGHIQLFPRMFPRTRCLMIPSASLRRARVPRQSRLLTVATLLVALGLALGLAGCGGPSQAASPLSVAAVNGHPISVSDYSQMLAFNKAENSQLGTFDWQSPSGRSNTAQAEQSTMDFLTGLELKRELLSATHGENAFAADLNKDRAILTDNIQRVENDPTQRKANAALLATLTDRVQFLLAEDQATEETLIKVLPIQTVHLRDIVVQDKGKAQ